MRHASEPSSGSSEPRSLGSGNGYLLPFALIHVGAVAALVEGVSATGVVLFLAVFGLQGFGITAGYHRYFAHRSFRTSRWFQLVLATLGTLAVQKSVLWWVANHRRHHRFADAQGDPHTPRDGLVWSHVGWFLASDFAGTDRAVVRDLVDRAELRWLDAHFVVPPALLALALLVTFGPVGTLWGFFLSTTVSWHLTYAVNSLGHRRGARPFDTADSSRNSFVLALLTFGEGWHNNHHRFPSSARQGIRWWEVDATYYALRVLARLGIVWDLIDPPASSRRGAAS